MSSNPLTVRAAWTFIDEWVQLEAVWVPTTSERTVRILGELLHSSGATGNLVTDAQLAAIAIEHGIAVVSADSDFARFTSVRWINPLSAASAPSEVATQDETPSTS